VLLPSYTEWVIRPSDLGLRRALTEGLGLYPLTAAVLVARGALSPDHARAILASENCPGSDPFLLADMESAVERLHRAVRSRERILLYGDYDVDGTSATALYLEFLKSLGNEAGFFIPQRLKDGYGLNPDAVRRIADSGVTLLITADCGTTSNEEISLARSLGMDVVVTDHHLPGERLPPALALLNPCRQDSGYPFQGLCSAGVAYKVAIAYAMKYGEGGFDATTSLDLVALATVADLAPLQGENRGMVQQGLVGIEHGGRLGIVELKRVAGIEGPCGVGAIGFKLAPRINAAGRLGDAADAVRLLVTKDGQRARTLAESLDRMNSERQQVEERVMADALEQCEAIRNNGAIVLASRGWHPGVVGIVAGRLVERYHRPVVLIAVNDEGIGRGSARSIPGVNIRDAIAECENQLVGFGGHAAAAGLTIRESAIAAFRERLAAALAAPLSLAGGRRLICDAELEPIGLLPSAIRELDRLGPFGMGNPEPTVVFRRLRITSARVVGNQHLKLQVRGTHGPVLTAFGFGMGAVMSSQVSEHTPVDLACALEINTWNGTEAVQLRVKDLRPSAAPASAIC
jgi:single-stranded-DNA-specific exonuclease